MGGFVVVAKLKDAAAFEKAMAALGEFAGREGRGHASDQRAEARRRPDRARLDHRAAGHGGHDADLVDRERSRRHRVERGCCAIGALSSLSPKRPTPSPCWTPRASRRWPASCRRRSLSFTYTDSQVQFNQTMMQLQQFWPMATMMAMQGGFKLPAMLPSLTHIAKDMGPSCSYSYYGPDGLYSYHRGPGIEVSLGDRGRRRRRCRRRVARAGQGTRTGPDRRLHEQPQADRPGRAHVRTGQRGQIPARIWRRRSATSGNAKILESPRKPKDFEGPSYIYIPDQSQKGDIAGNIVAYENPEFGMDKIPGSLPGRSRRER